MASGNTLAIFLPQDNEPPATIFATLDTRNQVPVLDFDGVADEEAVFSGIMPSHYAGGAIKALLHAMFTTAVTGTANLECSIERGNTDTDADSFAAMTNGALVPNATSGIETVATITLANADGVVAGDRFRFKVRRDADGTSGTDDITTDLELLAVELREA